MVSRAAAGHAKLDKSFVDGRLAAPAAVQRVALAFGLPRMLLRRLVGFQSNGEIAAEDVEPAHVLDRKQAPIGLITVVQANQAPTGLRSDSRTASGRDYELAKAFNFVFDIGFCHVETC